MRIRHRGFTLAELVISMSVTTILMGGVASAMLLATRAIPDRQGTVGAIVDGYYVVERMTGEMYAGSAFTIRTPTDVQFTVADRNNDGAPETIRYFWNGVVGGSLMRKYNNGTPVAAVEDVREFVLGYELQAETQPTPSNPNESTETLLVSNESTAWAFNDFVISANDWLGQYFVPTLPGGAISWKVTRVEIQAKVDGANIGSTKVQLRTPTAGHLPSSTVLEETDMVESELGAKYEWRAFKFGSVSGLSPSQGLCLVLQHLKAAPSAYVLWQQSGAATASYNAVVTSTAGTSWTARAEAVPFRVFGTVTTSSPADVPKLYRLVGVTAKLRLGGDSLSKVQTRVQIVNTPEVTD